MRKLLFLAVCLSMLATSCTSVENENYERISGTYFEVNQFGIVSKIYKIEWGKLEIRESDKPLFFEDGSLYYSDNRIEPDLQNLEDIIYQCPVVFNGVYSYENGEFKSDYCTGVVKKTTKLNLAGHNLETVSGLCRFDSEIETKNAWGLITSPSWNKNATIKMKWSVVNLGIEGVKNNGWWHVSVDFPTSTSFYFIWNQSAEIIRMIHPSIAGSGVDSWTPIPMTVNDDGLLLELSGSWEIYLSSNGTQMVIF